MTTCVSDAFGTAGPLTTTDTGQPWIITGPTYSASGGKAYQSVSSATQGFALVELGSVDQDVTISMTLGSAYAEGGLVLRYADTANFLALTLDRDSLGNDRLVLERGLTGGGDVLAIYTPAGLSLGAAYELRCVARALQISAYLNGTLVISHTLASIAPAGTKAGFSQHYGLPYAEPDDGTSRFDDLLACALGGWMVGAVRIA